MLEALVELWSLELGSLCLMQSYKIKFLNNMQIKEKWKIKFFDKMCKLQLKLSDLTPTYVVGEPNTPQS